MRKLTVTVAATLALAGAAVATTQSSPADASNPGFGITPTYHVGAASYTGRPDRPTGALWSRFRA